MAANFVLALLVEKDGAQNGPVALRKLGQDFAYVFASFARYNQTLHVDHFIRSICVIGLERQAPGSCTVMLQKHIVTDRVYKSTQAAGFAKTAVGAEGSQHAGEGLLAKIVNRIRR